MLRNRNKVDRRFQAEVDRLHPAPVRWEQVQRRMRRRRLMTFWSLILLALVLTVLLAGGLLAGRTALDPTFSPPIFSRSAVSGTINEPETGRELVPARSVSGLPGAEAAGNKGELGYVATAKVQLTDLEGSRVRARWGLREAGAEAPRSIGDLVLSRGMTITTANDTKTLRAWIPLPRRSGRYVIELRLIAAGGSVGQLRSQPFNALGRRCCRRYKTPTYVAAIPAGWKLRSHYQLASPKRYVSRLNGPNGMAISIDTTLGEQGNALNSQRELESLLSQGSERYRRLSVRQLTAQGAQLVEWSYRSGSKLYANELFYRGNNGYAVLGSSSPEHFREVRDISRRIAHLLEDRREG